MADSFDDAAALAAYKDVNSAISTYWTLFSGAALGVATIAVRSGTETFSVVRWGLCIAFGAFAVGNQVALLRLQRHSLVLVDSLRARASDASNTIPAAYRPVFAGAEASKASSVRIFHILMSFATLVAILVIKGST